jgi:hypothetical protein
VHTYPFADLALARRLERAEAKSNARFVELRAGLDPGRGACWIEVCGTYAMYDGPSSPVTQTFGLGITKKQKVRTRGGNSRQRMRSS